MTKDMNQIYEKLGRIDDKITELRDATIQQTVEIADLKKKVHKQNGRVSNLERIAWAALGVAGVLAALIPVFILLFK